MRLTRTPNLGRRQLTRRLTENQKETTNHKEVHLRDSEIYYIPPPIVETGEVEVAAEVAVESEDPAVAVVVVVVATTARRGLTGHAHRDDRIPLIGHKIDSVTVPRTATAHSIETQTLIAIGTRKESKKKSSKILSEKG